MLFQKLYADVQQHVNALNVEQSKCHSCYRCRILSRWFTFDFMHNISSLWSQIKWLLAEKKYLWFVDVMSNRLFVHKNAKQESYWLFWLVLIFISTEKVRWRGNEKDRNREGESERWRVSTTVKLTRSILDQYLKYECFICWFHAHISVQVKPRVICSHCEYCMN